MEDVFVHFPCDPAGGGVSALVQSAEKLLQPFPRRPAPPFTPWFPSTERRPLPIRPARPAPVIPPPPTATSPRKPPGGAAERQSLDGPDASPLKRRWSVFARRRRRGGAWPPRSPSADFVRAVSAHGLRPHQRAKWVITEQSCGAGRDMEQVWRALSRCVRGGALPGCNAHLQQERAEAWVFCDVLRSEQVGRLLKEALQLRGHMVLRVHARGDVFTL